MISFQRGELDHVPLHILGHANINSAAIIRCGIIRNRDIGSIKFCSGFCCLLRIHADYKFAARHINACAIPGCKHITNILHHFIISRGRLAESPGFILLYTCISDQIQSSIHHINSAALIGDSIPNSYAVQCQSSVRTGKPDYAAVIINAFIDTFVFGTIRIIIVGNIAA